MTFTSYETLGKRLKLPKSTSSRFYIRTTSWFAVLRCQIISCVKTMKFIHIFIYLFYNNRVNTILQIL